MAMSRIDKFPGNIATGQVSATATAGVVVAANGNRRCVTIINHGTTAVYLGASGVTAATGVLLAGVAGASLTICSTAAIYGITASGSQTVSYIEEYD